MPTVQPPKYSKVINQKTGNAEPCYSFIVEHRDSERLSCIMEEPLTIAHLERILKENTEWWSTWNTSFLEATAKHFSKPYTVQHIYKITKHHLPQMEDTVFPANVLLYPRSIQIHGGVFGVEWYYEASPVTIEIPELPEEEESLPVSLPTESSVQEMNLEEVPVDPNATEESIVFDTPTKFYEKNKVKEARLKAKIAMYRAQHQMNKYYEKYGTEVTDSDTEEESDVEEEEVQL